jgi:hypothetical protein
MLITNSYIKTREKRPEVVLKEQKLVLAQKRELERKLALINQKAEKLFFEFHHLRQEIEVEIETGFPHGRK